MTPDSGHDGHIWRLRTALLIPKYPDAGISAEGGLPTKLEFRSRLLEQVRRYGDIAVAVRKPANHNPMYGKNPQVEHVELVADVPAGAEARSAIERFTPVFETLVDLMAFEMAAVPAVGQVNMTDITPPVAVGDDRSWSSFAAPPFDLHARSVEMGAIQGRLMGELPESIDIPDSKTAAVLRWFVKALGTDLLHDQFIFLWIALEILLDASDVRVEEPYVGPCQHKIPACPDCGRATTRMVRGATMKAFLQSYGATAEQAKELWQMRQLMHGAIPFDSKKLENLGRLVQPLRAVVAAGLKIKLGKTGDDPPIVAAAGLSMHPAMGINGSGPITEDDVRPLIPAERQGNA